MPYIIGLLLVVGGIIFYSCSGDSDESGEKTVMQMKKNEIDDMNDELENR